MAGQFEERYIAREEHRKIVDYYRKLVAQLQGTIGELRTQVDAQAIASAFDHGRHLAARQHLDLPKQEGGPNVITFDFRRPR